MNRRLVSVAASAVLAAAAGLSAPLLWAQEEAAAEPVAEEQQAAAPETEAVPAAEPAQEQAAEEPAGEAEAEPAQAEAAEAPEGAAAEEEAEPAGTLGHGQIMQQPRGEWGDLIDARRDYLQDRREAYFDAMAAPYAGGWGNPWYGGQRDYSRAMNRWHRAQSRAMNAMMRRHMRAAAPPQLRPWVEHGQYQGDLNRLRGLAMEEYMDRMMRSRGYGMGGPGAFGPGGYGGPGGFWGPRW
jgi:hypothetical protein